MSDDANDEILEEHRLIHKTYYEWFQELAKAQSDYYNSFEAYIDPKAKFDEELEDL